MRYLKLLHLLVLYHQSHAGSPLWWRTLVSLGPWSLATRSTLCCVITVNRASSRDSPPLYAAGPTANGTSPKSPAQAVSTPVEEVLNHEAVQHVFNALLHPSPQLQPTTSHLLSGAATTRITSNKTGTKTTTSSTRVTRSPIATESNNNKVTTSYRASSSLFSRTKWSSCRGRRGISGSRRTLRIRWDTDWVCFFFFKNQLSGGSQTQQAVFISPEASTDRGMHWTVSQRLPKGQRDTIHPYTQVQKHSRIWTATQVTL